MADTRTTGPGDTDTPTRRNFLLYATSAFVAGGGALAAWPLIDHMSPAADTLADMAIEDVDLGPIAMGQSLTVNWKGVPVFIRHRTADEIKREEAVDWRTLRDPQPDSARVKKADWAVVIGFCTRQGCLLKGQNAHDPRGRFDGWYCPCGSSHYDTSGRIRTGIARKNLWIPNYEFLEKDILRLSNVARLKQEMRF